MEIKIKKLNENAVIPQYAHPTDAGLDLVATSKDLDDNGNIVYGMGLAFEIPEGHVGLIFPRSSLSKKDLVLTHCPGVIDSGYRGEVTLKFRPIKGLLSKTYNVGDRIGQMIVMPYPKVQFVEADELSKTDRGEGGYGSTGN